MNEVDCVICGKKVFLNPFNLKTYDNIIATTKKEPMDEEQIETLCGAYEELKADDDEHYRKFMEEYPNEHLYGREKRLDKKLKSARQWYIKEKIKRSR